MILLMVQKSQTITWHQQNPVNNGINDLSLSGFNSPDLLVALNAGSRFPPFFGREPWRLWRPVVQLWIRSPWRRPGLGVKGLLLPYFKYGRLAILSKKKFHQKKWLTSKDHTFRLI